MSKSVATTVSTKNTNGITFVGEGIESDGNEIAVNVNVEIPESFEEASSEAFFGSEEAALEALGQDWQRRCVNAARPILRTADNASLDFTAVAQQAVSTYKPGRRGGFQPKVTAEELSQYNDVDSLRAFLVARGIAPQA